MWKYGTVISGSDGFRNVDTVSYTHLNICKKLANTYDNVLCIENDQNHGVSYTRNQGLDYADGTYLMFVDSDDYVEADYVETMIDVYKRQSLL